MKRDVIEAFVVPLVVTAVVLGSFVAALRLDGGW